MKNEYTIRVYDSRGTWHLCKINEDGLHEDKKGRVWVTQQYARDNSSGTNPRPRQENFKDTKVSW